MIGHTRRWCTEEACGGEFVRLAQPPEDRMHALEQARDSLLRQTTRAGERVLRHLIHVLRVGNGLSHG